MIAASIDKRVSRQIKRRLSRVASRLDRAQSMALNRTSTGTVAQASKQIREEVNVKASTLKRAIKKHRASPRRPVAAIDVPGAHIPVGSMGARQTKKGVTFRPYKEKPRRLLKSAFMPGLKSGKRSVFRREGRARYPIKHQYGPSVMGLWRHREDSINRYAVERLNTELKRQIEFYRNRG